MEEIIVKEVIIVKPQGKGMAVAGFVISLVAIVFAAIVFGSVAINVGLGGGMGFGYFWVVLCLLSVILCSMGMMKLGKTGGKRGLAIAGLVIGLVALIWSVMLLVGINAVSSELHNNGDIQQFQDALNELNEQQ